jgi:CO/xanthine dehydrogenase Mo-binding subunit
VSDQRAAQGDSGVHLADFEVDPETMAASIVSYTAFQNVGKAVHPDYAEGQMQCGAVQGIGWALKEESVYGSDGKLQNEGFLDDRIPVALDLPPIGTVILEIPNSGHPYGVRGVGESPIVPPLSSESNAVSRLFGTRLRSLSMSPAKILAEIDGE